MSTTEASMIDPLADFTADELRDLLREVAPQLRKWSGECPDCRGYGAITVSDDQEEECLTCKPTRDLIERIEPKRAPEPPPATVFVEACGKEFAPHMYCVLEKGHGGDCEDDIPF